MRREKRQLDAAASTLRSQIWDYGSLMLNYSEDFVHIVCFESQNGVFAS